MGTVTRTAFAPGCHPPWMYRTGSSISHEVLQRIGIAPSPTKSAATMRSAQACTPRLCLVVSVTSTSASIFGGASGDSDVHSFADGVVHSLIRHQCRSMVPTGQPSSSSTNFRGPLPQTIDAHPSAAQCGLLYGHLSTESLDGLAPGQRCAKAGLASCHPWARSTRTVGGSRTSIFNFHWLSLSFPICRESCVEQTVNRL